jgi:ribonuclease BN (tRNA processing enzyme)
MTRDFFAYEKLDIETRMADEGRADPRKSVTAHDLVGEGLVLKNDDVTVTSCLVKHPPIERSYAFRFDTRDRSVVISGDTAYLPKLAEFAKGADVLIHEAMYLPAIDKLVKNATGSTRLRQHLIASHTTTDDVGRIASAADVKTLVLSHLVPGNDPSITDEMWAAGARKFFIGKIIVGKDLMEI